MDGRRATNDGYKFPRSLGLIAGREALLCETGLTNDRLIQYLREFLLVGNQIRSKGNGLPDAP
jgi:hypothetical protein